MNSIVWQRRFQPPALLVSIGLFLAGCNEPDSQATIDQIVAEMNQRIQTITLEESRDGIVPRFNQAKTVACVKAEFEVHQAVPDDLRKGLFSRPGTYPARLRFANATNRDDSKKDIRGLSIKVSGVDGPVLWGEPGEQDFLLNSYPALFVATPEEFLSFIRARQEDRKLGFFLSPLDPHFKSLRIVFKARQKHLSPLDIRYWSTVPFSLGQSDSPAVKYSVTPCSGYRTDQPVDPGKNQLRAAVRRHLQLEQACFEFGLQKQTDPKRMPIEDATVIWNEREAPFRTVATIRIEPQTFDSPEQLNACERMSFNPWQSLPDHRPLGRMNQARKQVYAGAERVRNKE